MNTTTLKNAGIEIQKNVATLEELEEECPQARRLAQYLLDFRQIVSHERWVRSHIRLGLGFKELFALTQLR